jgi:hypothetical protein
VLRIAARIKSKSLIPTDGDRQRRHPRRRDIRHAARGEILGRIEWFRFRHHQSSNSRASFLANAMSVSCVLLDRKAEPRTHHKKRAAGEAALSIS